MRRLHLVRHAQTKPVPGQSSHAWRLTGLGERQAADLADLVRPLGLRRILTSEEPKTIATGAVLARALGLPAETRPGVQEQARATAPYFENPADFHAALRDFFARPAERVFGEEGADEAHARFRAALQAVMAESDADELVVTHGTVLSLFVARSGGLDAFAFWQGELTMPLLVTLEWPSGRLLAKASPNSATRNPG